MKYIEVKTGPWSNTPISWWCKLLAKIIPPANPDFETFYPETRTWWVELDEMRVPSREMGFDATGRPIVLAPFGRNHGFIVDTSAQWREDDTEIPEAKAKFQTTWDDLAKQHEHLAT